MKSPTDAELLDVIEQFVTTRQIPPTRFGMDAMSDGALLPQLRAGRSLSLKNVQRILSYIHSFDQAAA
jgi:hypothetical protein